MKNIFYEGCAPPVHNKGGGANYDCVKQLTEKDYGEFIVFGLGQGFSWQLFYTIKL